MAEKKPDTVGSFFGFITTEGKLRMQMRTEKSSSLTGISHKGDFELTGGGVKERDLRRVLTLAGLLDEAIREAKEELGIIVTKFSPSVIYRTVYENPETGKVDWAFMMPVVPHLWDEAAKIKRKTVDVDPDQLNVLGELGLIVSGKKRMWRMGQAAICLASSRTDWRGRAGKLLTKAKSDWQTTELLINPFQDLFRLRYEIGLEDLSGGF